MTLRDLTKRQLYNLRRRCEKERKITLKRQQMQYMPDRPHVIWRDAYNAGLKAGLEFAK